MTIVHNVQYLYMLFLSFLLLLPDSELSKTITKVSASINLIDRSSTSMTATQAFTTNFTSSSIECFPTTLAICHQMIHHETCYGGATIVIFA